MFPVTSQLPPAWALPAILEELAAATSDLEAVGMCVERLREADGRIEESELAGLWTFVEEARSYAREIAAHADALAGHLVGAFLTPDGWPMTPAEQTAFRETSAERTARRGAYDCSMTGELG